jgi:hypothetical protein
MGREGNHHVQPCGAGRTRLLARVRGRTLQRRCLMQALHRRRPWSGVRLWLPRKTAIEPQRRSTTSRVTSAARHLTPRSSGAPTAVHQARAGGTLYIFTGPGLVACRRLPLSSNVRPRKPTLWIVGSRSMITPSPHAGWLPAARLKPLVAERPQRQRPFVAFPGGTRDLRNFLGDRPWLLNMQSSAMLHSWRRLACATTAAASCSLRALPPR